MSAGLVFTERFVMVVVDSSCSSSSSSSRSGGSISALLLPWGSGVKVPMQGSGRVVPCVSPTDSVRLTLSGDPHHYSMPAGMQLDPLSLVRTSTAIILIWHPYAVSSPHSVWLTATVQGYEYPGSLFDGG